MEKKRVEYGETYWYINIEGTVTCSVETGWVCDRIYFNSGNYFTSQKEAETMARKVRAVLAGADVIEMPSEDESLEAMPQNMSVGQKVVWSSCYYWLKSKIIK